MKTHINGNQVGENAPSHQSDSSKAGLPVPNHLETGSKPALGHFGLNCMNTHNTSDQVGESAPVVQSYATKTDVARLFQVTTRTIDSWLARGLLPSRKIGRTVRFSLAEIEQHQREHFLIGSRSTQGNL